MVFVAAKEPAAPPAPAAALLLAKFDKNGLLNKAILPRVIGADAPPVNAAAAIPPPTSNTNLPNSGDVKKSPTALSASVN
jgi:hypothetical protein